MRDPQGMTLRDYFAAQALQGYLAMYSDPNYQGPTYSDAAESAYNFADAMLKAREQ